MGSHLMDHSMWALDLGYPTTIETVATPFNGVCFPHATMTIYEFPARGGKPPVKGVKEGGTELQGFNFGK